MWGWFDCEQAEDFVNVIVVTRVARVLFYLHSKTKTNVEAHKNTYENPGGTNSWGEYMGCTHNRFSLSVSILVSFR